MVKYSVKYQRLRVAYSKARCVVVLCARHTELVAKGVKHVETALVTYGVSYDLQEPVWYDSGPVAQARFDQLVA